MKKIEIPWELLWDYDEAPEDLLWRLQRIAEFFPLFGRDRDTVLSLWQNIDRLKIDMTTRLLIEEYRRAWEERDEKDRRSSCPHKTAASAAKTIREMGGLLTILFDRGNGPFWFLSPTAGYFSWASVRANRYEWNLHPTRSRGLTLFK